MDIGDQLTNICPIPQVSPKTTQVLNSKNNNAEEFDQEFSYRKTGDTPELRLYKTDAKNFVEHIEKLVSHIGIRATHRFFDPSEDTDHLTGYITPVGHQALRYWVTSMEVATKNPGEYHMFIFS